MIAQSGLIGMLLAITICFFAPAAILFWLMVKKRTKMVLFMLIFGAITRIAGLIVQAFLVYCLDNIDGYMQMHLAIRIIISNIIYALIAVMTLAGLLLLLKKNGLTYARAWTISVGYSALEVMLGIGMSYSMKLINYAKIKDGSINDEYTKEQVAKLTEEISNTTFLGSINDGYGAVLTIIITALCVVLLLYGLSKDKLSNAITVTGAIIFVYQTVDKLVTTYAGNIASCVVKTLVLVAVLIVMKKLSAKEKEMMIKPQSMNVV